MKASIILIRILSQKGKFKYLVLNKIQIRQGNVQLVKKNRKCLLLVNLIEIAKIIFKIKIRTKNLG